jgi:hypothetical protein
MDLPTAGEASAKPHPEERLIDERLRSALKSLETALHASQEVGSSDGGADGGAQKDRQLEATRVLEDPIAEAFRALDSARQSNGNRQLRALLWSRLARAHKALGKPERARVDEYVSNRIHPSPEAGRLSTKRRCDAHTTRAAKDAHVETGWLGLFRWLHSGTVQAGCYGGGDTPSPQSNDEAKTVLCGDNCSKKTPWLATYGDEHSCAMGYVLVLPMADSRLGAFVLGERSKAGRCPDSGRAWIESTAPLHVVKEGSEGGAGMVSECFEAEADGECRLSMSGCFTNTIEREDFLFDSSSGRLVLTFSQSRPAENARFMEDYSSDPFFEDVAIEQVEGGFHFTNVDCDETFQVAR